MVAIRVIIAMMERLAFLKTNVQTDARSLTVCKLQGMPMPMAFPFGISIFLNHFVGCAPEFFSISCKPQATAGFIRKEVKIFSALTHQNFMCR